MLRLFLLIPLLVFSSSLLANFKLEGTLQLHLQNGQQLTQRFPVELTREEGAYQFTAGALRSRLVSPPQKYSLSLILQNNQDVYVTDFSQSPLQGFQLDIAGQRITLSREVQARAAPGRYVVRLNDEIFYFSRGPGQVNFIFNSEGIAEIRIQGMFKPRR